MLRQRIITALIIAPIAIACVFLLPPAWFAVFVGAVLTVGAWEWANLAGFDGIQRYFYSVAIAALLAASIYLPPLAVLLAGAIWWLVAFVLVIRYPKSSNLWSPRIIRALLGVVIMVPGFVGLYEIKKLPDASFLIVLLFLLIWGADIGAYFSGRAFGKRKLAPDVSPGKSWAGLYGGVASAMVIAVAMMLWYGAPNLATPAGLVFLLCCALIVLVSVLGDLAESMFKRYRGIKDSSNLLPGHGGVLDRIDSLLSAGPLFALLLLVYGWGT